MSSPQEAEFAGTPRFTIRGKLGAGGMGVVYEAHDLDRDARVAIKVLPRVDPSALVRFKREFRSLASIVHPNLIEFYELFAEGDQWFFSMEVIDGVDFLAWVRPDAVDLGRLRQTLRQLVQGVDAIHSKGRLHHDLKPSNVMVRHNGNTVILDFGLVGELGAGAGEMAGTAAYMAPEQWGTAELTAARDWYAVGVMLYEALTGVHPFQGKPADILRAKLSDEAAPPSSIVAGVPADLDALCCDLLRRDPAQRPVGADILARLGASEGVAVAPRNGGESLLVGRDSHLQQLREAYEQVEGGATVTAHIHGPSGTGKSALLSRFLSDMRQLPDTVVLSGRCYEQESVPYKALDSLVDALADYLAALDPGEVEPLVPVQAAVLARVFPVLQRVPAIARAPAGISRMSDPRELRRAAMSALREMLTRIGQRKHLALAIDDLQWGDVDSALVIGELLAPPDPPRLLLVLAYRSEYTERSPCLATLRSNEVVEEPWLRRLDVPVTPLSPAEGSELARRLIEAGTGVAKADVERIARESGGNPYFINELTRHLAQRELVQGADTSGPADLDGVLWSRVLRLPATAREILAIVAVAGQPIELGTLLTMAPSSPDLQHALSLLRAEHLLRSAGNQLSDEIETFHDRIRECVTNRLPPPVLRQHHASLAATLEATGTADAETLAGHFEGAEEYLKAAHYCTLGASNAAAALAFDRAATLYRRALRFPAADPSLTYALHRELGHALANAGRGFESAEAYLAAAPTAPEADRFELERLAAQQYCVSGYVREGRVIFRRLLQRVGLSMPNNPALILGMLVARRTQLRLRGVGFTQRAADAVPPEQLRQIDLLWSVAAGLSLPDALGVASLQTKGLLLALRAGEPYRLARALAFEAFLTGTAGTRSARRAAALIAKAESLAHQIDDPHAIGVTLVMKAFIAHVQNRFHDAMRHAEEAEALLRSRCSGVWWEISTARTIITWSLFLLGEAVELRRRNAIYLAEAADRGDRFLLTNLRSVTSPFLLLLDDDPEAASAELEEAMRSWPREGFDLQHANEMYSRANIEIYRGRGSTALYAVDERWGQMVRGLQLQTQQVRIMMSDIRARAALAAAESGGDRATLVKRAEKIARQLAGEGATLSDPFSHCLMAGIASLRGDRGLAIEQLRQALATADAAADGFRSLAARHRLGELLPGSEGESFRQEAMAIFTRDRIRNPARFAALFLPGFPAS